MAEINDIEIIQNKIDALVEKIVQKENSDEEFRITYAQILEKINTKMDVFSSTENVEKIGAIAYELAELIKDKQDVVDSKFASIKNEFEQINSILENSLKTPELLAVFNKIENQIHYFAEEQENQKFAFNSIISHIEKFGTLEEIKEEMDANFSIVKEQNSVINENANKQIAEIIKLNSYAENFNDKTLQELNSITFELKDLSENADENALKLKVHINDKINEIVKKIQETHSFIEIMNSNLTTLIEVVANQFEEEDFVELKSDIADILVKTTLLSESLKNTSTKDETNEIKLILENTANKQSIEEIKSILENTPDKNELNTIKEQLNSTSTQDDVNILKDNIKELENNLIEKLDLNRLNTIRDISEKIFYQGTEQIKEDVWSMKDTIAEYTQKALQTELFLNEANELKSKLEQVNQNIITDVTDVISEESIAASSQIQNVLDNLTSLISEEKISSTEQLKNITETIDCLKNEINEIVLTKQNEQLETALNKLKGKLTTQFIQIADNIDFTAESMEITDVIYATNEELKAKIETDILKIAETLNQIDSNIGKDIQTLISGFKILTNGLGDNKDYVYTLPDIESDLTRISLELNNLKKLLYSDDKANTECISEILKNIKEKVEKIENSPLNKELVEVKELFKNLSDDVTSISKRTNKLILTSDGVNKILKSNINAFTTIVNAFEKQSREFYNSTFMTDLSEKVDALSNSSSKMLQTDIVLTEAFGYLGEWIDSTSVTFNELKDDVSKITNTLISNDESITKTVIELNLKVEEQSQKMEALEDKLNLIIAKQNETQEVKSLLEYIVTQISNTNEKIAENDNLAKDLNSINKQLKNIENKVTAITEYLDDEEEYDE